MHPTARTSGLVLKTLGDEVLVYDLETHRAHNVNQVAVAVWRRCDGTRDAARIAADLREGGLLPVTEEAVQYALGELGRARLLTGSAAAPGLTRREVMRRLGTAAAVALPVVTTIVAPTTAQAQSIVCLNENDPCTSDQQCCGAGCIAPGGSQTCTCFNGECLN
ncbi:MAG: PqqD family protein [Gemmatimonadales bacterium]